MKVLRNLRNVVKMGVACLAVVMMCVACDKKEQDVSYCDEDISYCDEGVIISSDSEDTVTMSYLSVYCDTIGNFCLQMDSVLRDSRCPIGVMCCWAGDAEVSFSLISNGNITNFTLHTLLIHKDTTINNIDFKLLSVDPYPKIDEMPINQEDYSVKLFISKP